MIEDYDQKLFFRMTGTQFEKDKNIYYLTQGLDNFLKVLERSYLTIQGKQRMSEKDREVFQVKALKFSDGSFLAQVGIFLATTYQLALPYITTLTPKQIWDLVKNGFQYIRFVLDANSRGEQLILEAGENNMINVFKGNNNVVLQITPEVLGYVKRSENYFENMSQMINPEKGVSTIEFFDESDEVDTGVRISGYEKKLFESKTQLEKEVVEFKGKVFRVDAREYYGKLIIVESKDEQLEPNEEYSFSFINPPDTNTLSDCLMKVRTIYALKETTFDAYSLKRKVKKLQIIAIEK